MHCYVMHRTSPPCVNLLRRQHIIPAASSHPIHQFYNCKTASASATTPTTTATANNNKCNICSLPSHPLPSTTIIYLLPHHVVKISYLLPLTMHSLLLIIIIITNIPSVSSPLLSLSHPLGYCYHPLSVLTFIRLQYF